MVLLAMLIIIDPYSFFIISADELNLYFATMIFFYRKLDWGAMGDKDMICFLLMPNQNMDT